MVEAYATLEVVSHSAISVVILGETGVGKDVFAQALHATSARRDQAFVKLNCAALPENLLEAELFGYEKGAFTGATAPSSASSRPLMAAPCSWTKLAKCRSPSRRSSCACSRAARCFASAA